MSDWTLLWLVALVAVHLILHEGWLGIKIGSRCQCSRYLKSLAIWAIINKELEPILRWTSAPTSVSYYKAANS